MDENNSSSRDDIETPWILDQFSWLESFDRFLLGLWKGFFYFEKKSSHFEVYSRNLRFESVES